MRVEYRVPCTIFAVQWDVQWEFSLNNFCSGHIYNSAKFTWIMVDWKFPENITEKITKTRVFLWIISCRESYASPLIFLNLRPFSSYSLVKKITFLWQHKINTHYINFLPIFEITQWRGISHVEFIDSDCI